ncbi:MAG: dsbA [Gemmatimonadetes bacterium]|jgi:predicted DsbA family dithiol-disulfide isomerase|nr:dsbA [Gemmatimonadota bacterium]
MQIDIWSDIACPWCYVGKRRFEQALSRFEHRDRVTVQWRSFELDPGAPAVQAEPQAELLARKYRMPLAQAEAMNARMTAAAAEEGLDFHFERVKVGNTFDAHRLVHLAHASGLQDAMKERLMRAYLTEGLAIGTQEVLQRLAEDVGLDAEQVRATLASDRFADEVRGEENDARELGITGVPFFVLGGKYGVSGAQSPDTLLEAIRQAYAETEPKVTMLGGDAAACGPDGCEIR